MDDAAEWVLEQLETGKFSSDASTGVITCDDGTKVKTTDRGVYADFFGDLDQA